MKVSIEFLTRRGIDEARLTVELLLAFALNCPRLQLYTRHDLPLSEDELNRFRSLVKRRLANEPVQYITGEAHFMGMQFAVDQRVLIPRPETETLVEQLIVWSKDQNVGHPLRLLDVGTGSGNIAVACAKFVPALHVVATDVNPVALDVARQNAEQHGVTDKIECVEWDMMRDPPAPWRSSFNAVVSNPPYIPLAEWESLEPLIRDFEPQRALTDGGDGLTFHRRLASIALGLLDGRGPLLLEVADGQANEVRRIMKELGADPVTVIEDLSRVPRVVSGIFSRERLQ